MSRTDQAENVIKHAKENQQPFLQTFAPSKDAGVASYEVKLANGQDVYYGTFGTGQEPTPSDFQPLTIAESFSEEAVIEALRRPQASKTNYFEWLAETAHAGVFHYWVNMEERTVVYYDKDEKNSCLEPVPL